MQVGRLAGDREVDVGERLADERVDGARVEVVGLLVGHADEAHAHLVLVGGVADGAHHRRQRALHVVGAAADQAVALDARLELALAARDDVDVAVQDDLRLARAVRRAGRRDDHRQALVGVVAHPDVARLQPALDEARGGAQAVARWTCRR